MLITTAKKETLALTQELQTLINDGQRLLHYVVRHGDLTVDPEIVEGFARANAKLNSKHWTVSDEAQLLHCYDKLACQVYPVTVESIKAVIPHASSGKLSSPTASRTISWYRHCTVFTLLCLLIIQMFYLFGYTLIQALLPLSPPISFPLTVDLEANYLLLKQWNQIWMLGQTLPLELKADAGVTLENEVGVEFSAQLISAQSFLQMLQNYILPLMYGLLGAFIFVLRNLLQQVRSLTYTASREIGYRLRLTLGCLAGMITGWLLKPEMGEMTLSPMAIAFIAGYSIEVLFTLLDRLMDTLRRQQLDTPAKTEPHRPR